MKSGFSIITCTNDSTQYNQMVQGYKNALAGETDYEFIPILGATSMAEGYNQGLEKAQYDKLIFTHQDAFPLRPGFGVRLRQHLRHFDIIGGAGTRRLEGPQWFTPSAPHVFGQVIHALPPTLNLGVAIAPLSTGEIVVHQLEPGGLAAKAGLVAGDKLLKFNGTTIDAPQKFQEQVLKLKQENAQSAICQVRRGDSTLTYIFDLSGGIPVVPLYNVCAFGIPSRVVGGIHAIDGFFMAVNRDSFTHFIAQFSPDESEGFHFYDLSFSYGAFLRGAKIGVACDLFLGHACMSQGYNDPKWLLAKDKWMKQWGPLLDAPVGISRQVMLTTAMSPDLNYIVHLADELVAATEE